MASQSFIYMAEDALSQAVHDVRQARASYINELKLNEGEHYSENEPSWGSYFNELLSLQEEIAVSLETMSQCRMGK